MKIPSIKNSTLPARLTMAGILVVGVTGAVASVRHHKAKSHPKHAATSKKIKKPKADPAIAPVVGTWYVNDKGKESHAQRLCLKSDGTFAFIGSGWKSEGRFTVRDGNLDLEWTAVDGEKVKPGSMHKAYSLNANLNSFTINKYTYDKHVEVAVE